MNHYFPSMLYCHNIGFSQNQPRCHSDDDVGGRRILSQVCFGSSGSERRNNCGSVQL